MIDLDFGKVRMPFSMVSTLYPFNNVHFFYASASIKNNHDVFHNRGFTFLKKRNNSINLRIFIIAIARCE
jgi:hypothetical protein